MTADSAFDMRPTFFDTPAAFGQWLRRHHAREQELWVGFHKKGSGRPSMTWPESVDEALCYGWIDGIRRSVGPESYAIRFTPRKPGSTWSAINTRRAAELIREGRMQPAGQRAFEARDPAKSGVYSFEQKTAARLGPELERRFRAIPAAWRFFMAQPPGYRRTAIWWIVSAKREETRLRRLQRLIDDSAAARRLGILAKEK